MKKPSIPALQGIGDQALMRVLNPMKENIELMTGIRQGTLQKLPENADLTAVIRKINEIIERVNAH
jgi:hypothetical protein